MYQLLRVNKKKSLKLARFFSFIYWTLEKASTIEYRCGYLYVNSKLKDSLISALFFYESLPRIRHCLTTSACEWGRIDAPFWKQSPFCLIYCYDVLLLLLHVGKSIKESFLSLCVDINACHNNFLSSKRLLWSCSYFFNNLLKALPLRLFIIQYSLCVRTNIHVF